MYDAEMKLIRYRVADPHRLARNLRNMQLRRVKVDSRRDCR